VTSAVSADWVLPVDGEPIEGGVVRYEDGRIVEVAAGRAERHFSDAVILPGFVNAHTHLEYANYAGFGDGMPFGPWITTHIARKRQLDAEGMLAVSAHWNACARPSRPSPTTASPAPPPGRWQTRG
jgi:cytosine/adenosine deaminase-related metal-dependent hydrolase